MASDNHCDCHRRISREERRQSIGGRLGGHWGSFRNLAAALSVDFGKRPNGFARRAKLVAARVSSAIAKNL